MRWAWGVPEQARRVLDAPSDDDGEGPVIEGDVGGAGSRNRAHGLEQLI